MPQLSRLEVVEACAAESMFKRVVVTYMQCCDDYYDLQKLSGCCHCHLVSELGVPVGHDIAKYGACANNAQMRKPLAKRVDRQNVKESPIFTCMQMYD